MSAKVRGSGSASGQATFDRTVAEAVRQTKRAAANDTTFVPAPDDANAVMAAQVFTRPIANPLAASSAVTSDDANTVIAGQVYGRQAIPASTATPLNVASAVVQRDASGNFAAGNITSDITSTTGKFLFGDSGLVYIFFDGVNFSIVGGGVGMPSLAVTAGFGCNGKSAQTAVSVGAAATDLASVIALANNLRVALINNGIAV